jgi:hypothetical protein
MTELELKIIDTTLTIRKFPYFVTEFTQNGKTVKIPTMYLIQLADYLKSKQRVVDFEEGFGVRETQDA